MRHPPQPARRRLLIAAVVCLCAALTLIAGYAYGPQLGFFQTVYREPPATGEPAGAANPLELSVLDRPHPLPEIRFADAEGRKLSLTDFRGRVALLNIWATWCVPCRKEMPALDRLEGELGGKDFIVLPLSIDHDGATSVAQFYRELGLERLGIYVDPSGRGSRPLALPGVPTTLLIDREGREIARKMGAAEWDGPELIALIRRYLPYSAAGAEGK